MDCSGRRSEGEERWNGDSSDVLLLPAARVAGSGTGCGGGATAHTARGADGGEWES
jgi:hypothetical protein